MGRKRQRAKVLAIIILTVIIVFGPLLTAILSNTPDYIVTVTVLWTAASGGMAIGIAESWLCAYRERKER